MKRIPKYMPLKGMGVAFLLFTLGSTISHGIFAAKVAWFFTFILRSLVFLKDNFRVGIQMF